MSVFQTETRFSTVNYLADDFTENVGLSKSKYQGV